MTRRRLEEGGVNSDGGLRRHWTGAPKHYRTFDNHKKNGVI